MTQDLTTAATNVGTLTARQAEVIGLVARGYRTRGIANALGVSERTITAHISRLMAKFSVPNRSGLIAAVMAAAGFGLPRSKRAPLTRLGAQAHLATLGESERDQYADAPFLVAVTQGPDHVFSYVNGMWRRVMGLDGADVIGKRVVDVFPDASPITYAARQGAYREGRPTAGNAWHYKWTMSDGTPREADFRYIYQPLRNSAGQIEGLLLIATEVGE
ncbi:MAG: LuxR C-terminal-related transcriptional regulator [Candidatus Limnocylindria bacterium]